MDQWAALGGYYPGWGLAEVQGLSPRERVNWQAQAASRKVSDV